MAILYKWQITKINKNMGIERKNRQLLDENRKLRLENQNLGRNYLELFEKINALYHSFRELPSLNDEQKTLLKEISSLFTREST